MDNNNQATPMDFDNLADRAEWLGFNEHVAREVRKAQEDWQARTELKEREWQSCFENQKRSFQQELANRQVMFEQQLKTAQGQGGPDPKVVIRQVNQGLKMLEADKGVLSQGQVLAFIQAVQAEIAVGNPVNIKSFLSTTAKHALILRFYKCLDAAVVDKWENWTDSELLRQLIHCWPLESAVLTLEDRLRDVRLNFKAYRGEECVRTWATKLFNIFTLGPVPKGGESEVVEMILQALEEEGRHKDDMYTTQLVRKLRDGGKPPTLGEFF